MTKICSVVPQILHNGNLQDSIAFSQLWEKAKLAFTDNVEARENAKAEYASYFSTEFRNKFGDWVLYRNIKEGIATDQDFIQLEKTYGSIENLKDSIKIYLNEQFEPIYKLDQNAESFSSETSNIIHNLGSRTKSENVVLPSDLNLEYSAKTFWSTIVPAAKEKYGDNIIIAYRGNKNKSFTENLKTNNSIGNPFTVDKYGTVTSNKLFINWLITGNNHSEEDASEDYRQAIISKFKESKNTPILYYKELSRPSHATSIDYLINKYKGDFNEKSETPTQLSLFDEIEKSSTSTIKSSKVTTKSSKVTTRDINSDYLPSKDHLLFNRVIASIILSSLDDIQSLKLIDIINNDTVKNKVINSLEEIADKSENSNLESIIDDIKNDRNHIWELAIGYISNKFNIRLRDTSSFEKEINISDDFNLNDFKEGVLNTKSEIPHNWDDSQLDMDLIKTTAYEIQLELSKSVYKNNIKDIINPNNNSEEIASNKYGLNMPLDIDDVWGQILSVNSGTSSKESILRNLKLLSKFNFNDALSDFINRLYQDDNFYNLFYRTANLSIVDNVTMIVDKDLDIKSKNTFSFVTNNRNAKAENVAYNHYFNNVNSMMISASHNLQDILNEMKTYSNNMNMLIKFNSLIRLSELLGVNISNNSLAAYLDNNYSGIPFNEFYSGLNTLTHDEKSYLLDKTNELFNKLDIITSSIFNSYGYDYKKIVKESKYANKATSIKNKRLILNDTAKGTLRTLANINKIDFANKTTMSYYNAEFNREQSPQYNSFITDLFDVISNESSTDEDIIKTLSIYTQDARLDYDNLLWDGTKEGHIGIFRYNIDNNGKKQIRSINSDAIKFLKLSQLSGVRSSNNGQHYVDIKDDNWNLTVAVNALNNKFIIPTSDSGRSYAINRDFDRFDIQLKDCIDEVGIIDFNSFSSITSFKNTRFYDYVLNNILQEFKDIQLTFPKLYDIDSYISDKGSKLKINKEYSSQKSRTKLLNKIECQLNESTGEIELIKNNKPSGNIFNISNLSYVKDGKLFTLASKFEESGFDYLRRILTSDINNLDLSTITIIDDFIGEWLYYNQLKTIEDLKYIKKEIINAESKYETNSNETEDGNTTKSKSLTPINDTLEGEELEDWKYNITALNLFLNHHFNSVIYGNIVVGNANEFKNMVDFNKRSNQSIRNGVSTSKDVPYRMLVMDNIELPSQMIDLFVEYNNGTSKELNEVKERYKKLIDTTNAIDIITDDELIKRLNSFGVYDRYKEYIDAIKAKNEDGTFKPLNPNIYPYLLEQMKFFSYSRELKDGRVISVQNKNSTIILFERFVRGTDKENLYKFMKKFHIDDINTSEGHKLGGVIPIKLHNENGTFNTSLLNSKEEDILNHSIILSHKNLRIQQEIVPHIKNETNRWATQLLKKTFDSLIDYVNYKVNGNSIKGRTGSFNDSERGIFEDFHLSLSYNAQDSMFELLNEFGAIENGQIKLSPDGLSIEVDVNKIGNTLQRYFIENSTDLNIIKAVSMNNGKSNLPYHHPSLIKLIENVLEAKITNKVTHQEVKGSHVPIQPDMFNEPIKGVKASTNQDTWITYSKEFLKECGSDNRNSRKLRSEYVDNEGVFHPAEIVLNPFDKRFYQEKYLMDDGSGRVDINKIPYEERLVFGTRIPHEGYQSSFVAVIVGFFQDGASTAITPDHLIYRTGWDFDIDSIYLYHKEVNGANEVLNINDNSETAINRRLDSYIKLRYPEQYNEYLRKVLKENSELYSQLKSIYSSTDKFIISHPDYIQAVKNLENKIDRAEKSIHKYELGSNNITEEEYNKKIIIYNNDISKLLKLRLSSSEVNAIKESISNVNIPQLKEIAKSFKYHDDIGAAIKDRIIKTKAIAEQIRLNKDKISEYSKFKDSKRSEFNKLDKIEQAIRQERNNYIIDLLISIHSDSHTFLNREKPNEYSHIASASNYVNAQLGFNNKNAQITNITDQMYFRNLNMNVATLKENSVAYDNILAILRTLAAYNKNTVPAIMKLTEVKGYNPNDTINTIHFKFTEIFGKDNFEVRGDKVYIKNIGYIANNASKNGKDIQGQFITEQRSELTSNILDAVKQLMVNLNQDTFAIFAYLSSTPLSYYTNIHTSGEAEINRYIYPALFISQPIIQELSRNIVLNNKFGDKQYSSYSISTIREEYYNQILNILTDKFKYNIESFILDQRSNFIGTSERHEENVKSKYNDSLNELFEYNKAVSNNKNKYIGTNLKWAINKYLESNSLNTIESRPYTLEELDNNIKLNAKNENKSLNYLINQLSILEYYNQVDKASSNITSLMSVLNTDKLGASPTSNTSNKLFNNIIKLANDYDNFIKYIKDTEDNSKSIIKRIEDTLYSKVSLKDKQDFITSVYDHYNFKGSPALTTPSGNVIEDVYGELLKSNNPNIKKSKYPYLQAQAYFTNLLSTRIYNNVILAESYDVKALLNKTLSELNSINDERVRYKLLNYFLNNNLMKEVKFFSDTDYSKIISALDIIETETPYDGKIIYRKELKSLDLMSKDTLESSINPIDTFNNLSLANQIIILKQMSNNQLLSIISPKLDKDLYESKGYIELSITDVDRNIDMFRGAFTKMFNSNNEYERIVARNLIKYAYVNNGLQFGSSISKYIDTELYYNSELSKYKDNDLYKSSDALYNIELLPTKGLNDEYLTNIHKANWDNTTINPLMEISTYKDNKGKSKINTTLPTWNTTGRDVAESNHELSYVLDHFILEKSTKIDKSKFANYDFLTKEYNFKGNVVKVLYKRFNQQIGGYYLYYPINKTLPYEYGSSSVSFNYLIPTNNRNNSILDEAQYLEIISELSIKKDTVKASTSSNSSYMTNIKKLHDESDISLYIEDRSHPQNKIARSVLSNTKSIVVTESELKSSLISINNKIKSKLNKEINTAFIFGSYSELSAETLNSIIERLIKNNTISSVTSIILPETDTLMDVGKAILKSDSILNKDVLSLDQNATTFDEVEYGESSSEAIVYSVMEQIKNAEENVLTTLYRLNKQLENTNVENRKIIENIVNRSKDILDNIDPTLPSMDAISDVILSNKIVYDFLNKQIDNLFKNMTSANLVKFTNPKYYNERVQFSKDIDTLKGYIIAANQLINMPYFDYKQISNMEPEDAEIIDSYNNAVAILHEQRDDLKLTETALYNFIEKYASTQVISKSRNPSNPESIYNKAIAYLKEEGHNLDDINLPNITDEDFQNVINRMMKNNEDISYFSSVLDSVRDTGITLVDVMGKVYADVLYRTHIDSLEKKINFDKLLSKVYKETGKEYNKDRESWFKSKFIDDNGDLITEYNYKDYQEKLYALNEVLNTHLARRREAINRKDRDAIRTMNAEIKKQRELIDKTRTNVELKQGSDEYEIYKDAYYNLPERSRKTYQINNMITIVQSDKGIRIFKHSPTDEYKNSRYEMLSKEEQEFLSELKVMLHHYITDVFPTYEVSNSFVPYSFNPKFSLKKFFTPIKSKENKFFIDLDNNIQYYLDASMIHIPKVKDLIVIPKEGTEQEKLNKINESSEEKFKTLKDVYDYNNQLKETSKVKLKEYRNYDISNLMHNLINQLNDVKVTKDFESDFRLTLTVLGSDDFQANYKSLAGKNVMDKVRSFITKKHEVIKKYGKENRIYDRYKSHSKALYNVGKINSNLDSVMHTALRLTSISTMGFNGRANIKNVIIGYTTMMVESISKEFMEGSHLRSAANQYRSAFISILKDADKDTSDNFTSAYIKHFHMIFADPTDRMKEQSIDAVSKATRYWETAAYIGLNGGEHFMQFNTLLAMSKSHRVVGGIAMSLADYINDRRLSIIEPHLDKSTFTELKNYIYDESHKETNTTNYVDYINEYLNKNYKRISKESKDAINNTIKDTYNSLKQEFESFETVEDQFELKNGYLRIKEGKYFEKDRIAEFADRVRKVNHSMHGVYNLIDRNQLQDSMLGELLMQFRKWQRPTFVRWFGARYGKTTFSEGTGTYRAGAFSDFWKFIGTPIARESFSKVPILEAISNLGKGYIEYLQNISYYYNKLPSHQKANVMRAIAQISSLCIASVLLYAAYAAMGSDDDDKKKALQNWWVANTVYQLSAIQSEIFDTTRLGWIPQYKRTRRSFMASERSMTDLASFVYYSMIYPFQDDKHRYYQRGIYKGESKAVVHLNKSIPLVRQLQVGKHLPNTISFYQMYNPIYNLIPNN